MPTIQCRNSIKYLFLGACRSSPAADHKIAARKAGILFAEPITLPDGKKLSTLRACFRRRGAAAIPR